jgi:probable F420-dependent oxidoreductase
VKVGVALRVRHDAMPEVARVAEDLGYESVWLPEHLVMPATTSGSPHPSGRITLDPTTPTLDVLLVLQWLAAATTTIRLGTYVYNLALRHPFVSARAVQTLDVLSGGRVELGVGAGWLREEWEAVGLDFDTRGERLDECLDVLRVLWTHELPDFTGRYHSFAAVHFEPKPVQRPVPVHVGGESVAALRRAAARGDGWIGMSHTPASAARQVTRLRVESERLGRPTVPLVTVGAAGRPSAGDLSELSAAGVDRVIVAPFTSTADAVDGLRSFAQQVLEPWAEG